MGSAMVISHTPVVLRRMANVLRSKRIFHHLGNTLRLALLRNETDMMNNGSSGWVTSHLETRLFYRAALTYLAFGHEQVHVDFRLSLDGRRPPDNPRNSGGLQLP